jgi:hypothetical protein
MVEFISSVDAVYKEMRLLRASIVNSGQLDRASEAIFNTCFYILAACIILAAIGLSPLALFFSFSSIILAFAFMIGSASAKYFEVSWDDWQCFPYLCVVFFVSSTTRLFFDRVYFLFCCADPTTLATGFTFPV